jgi:SAM-dependent methyltransferase
VSTLHHSRQTPHSLSERLLLFLSRRPEADDYEAGRDHWTGDDALSHLCRFLPDFLTRIDGKEVLDFGCGTGYQSVALARMGAKHVVGLDINATFLQKARELASDFGLAEQVRFTDSFTRELYNRFDVVISQSSMEHFKNPARALDEMKAAVKQDGVILITFGCPWYSPYGSHMHFFVRLPWVNILFDEKTVMNVRSRFRNDGAVRYEQVEGGLNKMSVKKFERLIRECDLEVVYKKYEAVKGISFVVRLPVLRELFVNNISCILAKKLPRP